MVIYAWNKVEYLKDDKYSTEVRCLFHSVSFIVTITLDKISCHTVGALSKSQFLLSIWDLHFDLRALQTILIEGSVFTNEEKL